jgi:hypothetical protein
VKKYKVLIVILILLGIVGLAWRFRINLALAYSKWCLDRHISQTISRFENVIGANARNNNLLSIWWYDFGYNFGKTTRFDIESQLALFADGSCSVLIRTCERKTYISNSAYQCPWPRLRHITASWRKISPGLVQLDLPEGSDDLDQYVRDKLFSIDLDLRKMKNDSSKQYEALMN